jgi:hypothetical protein
MPVSEIVDGTCEGYLVEMEEIIRRATEYAKARSFK